MMTPSHWSLLVAAHLLAAFTARSDEATTPDVPGETLLLSVLPEGGATDVDPNDPIKVRLDHRMMSRMEDYALLHLGDVTGPAVGGTWSLSSDRTVLAFTPDTALQPATPYTIHLGGGMIDGEGHPVDWQTHGTPMGGEWATGTMTGSGMRPGMGMGGAVGGHHMDSGWVHANGSYGMVFTFTTGA